MTSIRNIRKRTYERLLSANNKVYKPKFTDFGDVFPPHIPGFVEGIKPDNPKVIIEVSCSNINVLYMGLPVRRFDHAYSNVKCSALTAMKIQYISAVIGAADANRNILDGEYKFCQMFPGCVDDKVYMTLDRRLMGKHINHAGGGYSVSDHKVVVWFN